MYSRKAGILDAKEPQIDLLIELFRDVAIICFYLHWSTLGRVMLPSGPLGSFNTFGHWMLRSKWLKNMLKYISRLIIPQRWNSILDLLYSIISWITSLISSVWSVIRKIVEQELRSKKSPVNDCLRSSYTFATVKSPTNESNTIGRRNEQKLSKSNWRPVSSYSHTHVHAPRRVTSHVRGREISPYKGINWISDVLHTMNYNGMIG